MPHAPEKPLSAAICEPLRTLVDWVYPRGCLICGRPSPRAVPFCGICNQRLPNFRAPLCPACQNFAPDGRPHPDCAQGGVGSLSLIWFAGFFDKGYRELIHGLKYQHQLAIGEFFGRRIGRNLRRHLTTDTDRTIIVPVPLHQSRRKQRGYNQSDAIATGVAHSTAGRIAGEALVRTHKTADQTKLSPKERIANVRGAFAVRQTAAIAGQQVILVDDVSTTGATLEECTRTLFAGGAESVMAVVIALSRGPGLTTDRAGW